MVSHSTPPYTIGFFTTGIDLEYSSLLAHTISKVAKANNINIINFLGGSLNPNFSFSQYKYQYQCNVAFNYGHTPHIDGIILASAILACFLDSNEFNEFYSQFKTLPLVSLGVNIPDLPSVYTNSCEIFTELTSHIINVHHRKKIALITGPINNTDSFERYSGYVKALYANNVPYLPEFVYIADFTPSSATQAIVNLIDEKHLDIDSIICANDSMALTVISELKKRGISIPEDIMVTGCDNLQSVAYSVPSLTSVAHSPEKAAEEAIHLLINKIEKKTLHNVVIPSKIFYRESCPYLPLGMNSKYVGDGSYCDKLSELTTNILQLCMHKLDRSALKSISDFLSLCLSISNDKHKEGCDPMEVAGLFLTPLKIFPLPLNVILQLKDYLFQFESELIIKTTNISAMQQLTEVFNQIQHYIINCVLDQYDTETVHMNQNFNFIRDFLLTITHNISDRTKQLQSIIPSLMDFGIHSCLIYLYPSGIIHNLSDNWHMPTALNLYMGFVDGSIISPDTLPLKVNSEDVATYGLNSRDKNYVAYLHPIFFGNEQLGLCVFEMEYENYTLIESITIELACALKLTSTFTVQRQVEQKLETLSQTDELTGLLNRRGFFNLSQDKYAFSLAAQHNGILFYADMDGLKTINDTYGHHEGDYAIIAMAHILKASFPNSAIIGRIGGDEFVILCINEQESYIDQVTVTINQLCLDHNHISGKPYKLSISVGGIFYTSHENESLELLLSKADKLLYKNKRLKKELQKEECASLI